MAVLVTGATGRVGSRLVRRLLQRQPVRILVRNPVAAEPLAALGAEVVVGDITDSAAIEQSLKGVDSVVHLATVFRTTAEDDIDAVNHAGTVELAEQALRADIRRFVYASTNQVYGHGRGRPALETDLPAPDRPYSITKADTERSLLELQLTDGLELRIFRIAVIYGDGDPHLNELVRFIMSWPSHRRMQLVHHADVLQALLLGLSAEGVDGEIFNVGDDCPLTAHEILAINNLEPDREATSRPLLDPWEGIIDSTKIRQLLGFRPIYPTVYSARDVGAL